MTEISDQLLARVVEAIVETSAPEKIILFGSRARGAPSQDSDVDLLVIESEPFGPDRSRRKETSRLAPALLGFTAPIDLLVYSREEVERWRDSINHVIALALREGKVIYERP